mmetsp:Transcript_935/g.1518  ORF Transcript_935/g.1518 Transcript_935/m.1518 type:complete len:167 (-) Transcript_935:994-1494(-)
MAAKELNDLQKVKLPAAFNELSNTHQSIPPIVKYCKDAYSQSKDQREVYQTTVKYTGDVLTNIAYHTNNVATQLTRFLQLQLQQIESVDLQLKSVSLRLAAMKEATGAQGLRRSDAVKTFPRAEKLAKLSSNDLPGNARSLTAWKRVGAVDYGNPESINRAVVGRP